MVQGKNKRRNRLAAGVGRETDAERYIRDFPCTPNLYRRWEGVALMEGRTAGRRYPRSPHFLADFSGRSTFVAFSYGSVDNRHLAETRRHAALE